MYLTPVVYGATLIPERFRWLLALNPMTACRRRFPLGAPGDRSAGRGQHLGVFALSLAVVFVVLVSGLVFFRRTERTFADII